MTGIRGAAFWRSLCVACALVAFSTAASAQSPFSSLEGAWSGSGQIKLEGGKTESIRCKAYYNTKSGGSALSLAIRCASASNKIEMRASLEYAGGSISGSWEERTFNAAGNVTGHATASRISLSINGGGLNGSMSVSLGGSRQQVSISTDGVALKGVSISLSRG